MSDTSVDEDDNGGGVSDPASEVRDNSDDSDNNDTLHTPLPHVDGQPVSFTPSAGDGDRTSGEQDANIPTAESTSPSQTRWYPEDGEGRKWDRLKELDETIQSGDDTYKSARDQSLHRRDLRTAASHIELTTAQTERALALFNSAETGTHDVDAVILAALTLAVNEDDRALRPEMAEAIAEARADADSAVNEMREVDTASTQTALYAELRASWNVTPNDVRNARQLIRDGL